MMRIAVMTDTMDRTARGTAGYTRKLVEGLIPVCAEQGAELYLIHSGKNADPLYGKAHELLLPRVRVPRFGKFLSEAWFWRAHRGEFDVIHYPQEANYPSYFFADAKIVITMHSHLEGWKHFGLPVRYRQVRSMLRHAGNRIAAFITPSESTKRGITDAGVPAGLVKVIPLAADDAFFRAPEKKEAQRIVAALGVKSPYLYAPGRSDPQKNIPRVIEAFAKARREAKFPHQLVIGAKHRPDEDARIEEAISKGNISDAVHILSEAPQELMPALFAGADAVIYPSLHEGFGLPLLEAMAAGTPVVTSNAYSMPEVAGGAAVLVNPESTEEIAQAIMRIIGDPAYASELAARGKANAKKYSYARMAADTFALYQELCR